VEGLAITNKTKFNIRICWIFPASFFDTASAKPQSILTGDGWAFSVFFV